MSRPRIVFCYRYGLLGGVSAQLLNRFPYLSDYFDIRILFEQDYGMARRFPDGVASVTAAAQDRVDAIRHARPDVTVVIDSPSFIDAWRMANSPGRLVLEVHTTTANLVYLDRRNRLDGVSHIITVSAYMAQMLTDLGMADLAPITIVPNCLDDRWRVSASPRPLGAKPLLWVGKLDGHKRWRTATDIVDMVVEAAQAPVTPVFVGGMTSPESEVRAFTTRLSVSAALARAVWWPRVEYARMPEVYAAVGANGGVHLSTTVNESFGMAVAESVIGGCPVVAPRVGALPELLPPQALYEPGNWQAARDMTLRALVDDQFRTELLSSADQIRDLTRPEQVARAYREVVASVLGAVPAASTAQSTSDPDPGKPS